MAYLDVKSVVLESPAERGVSVDTGRVEGTTCITDGLYATLRTLDYHTNTKKSNKKLKALKLLKFALQEHLQTPDDLKNRQKIPSSQ